MIRKLIIISFFLCMSAGAGNADDSRNVLVLDDFEGEITAGRTIDAASGNGSTVVVAADDTQKTSGEQSLKISYDAVPGGYIRVARGYGLDAEDAGRWLAEPVDINWDSYGAISFSFLGSATGAKIAFDVQDANNEAFRFIITDDSRTWKTVVCTFDNFLSRDDWQPANAVIDAILDFPIKSFQFEPVAVNAGSFNIDEVVLEPLN